jgi:Flp pilus assembly protein TadD
MKEIFDFFSNNSLGRRGERKIQQGDYEGAIQDLNQALSINPNDALAYGNRGYARAR